jgi:DNA (cytosine-5)-methyltransferase 1
MAKGTKYFLSLFAGAGGLDLGLHRSGLQCLWANDFDRLSCETLQQNQQKLGGNFEIDPNSITDIDPKRVMRSLGLKEGELDLLAGGPPCQAFSTAGRRQAFNDQRGDVAKRYFNFLRTFRPKFAIMENVRGIMSVARAHTPIADRVRGEELTGDRKPGSVIEYIKGQFSKLGYYPNIDLYDAVYYGVPQTRQRVFIVAFDPEQYSWEPPQHSHEYQFPKGRPPDRNVFMGEVSDGRKLKRAKTLGNAIRRLSDPNKEHPEYPRDRAKYYDKLEPGQNWTALSPKDQKSALGGAYDSTGGRVGFYRRLNYSRPCPTVLTSVIQKATGMCHPEDLRPLTVRECAAVQQFPKGWKFSGSMNQKYKQIGNAVPVGLAEVFGRSILRSLK